MESNANVEESVDQVLKDEYYDQNTFFSLKFLQLYDHLL